MCAGAHQHVQQKYNIKQSSRACHTHTLHTHTTHYTHTHSHTDTLHGEQFLEITSDFVEKRSGHNIFTQSLNNTWLSNT